MNEIINDLGIYEIDSLDITYQLLTGDSVLIDKLGSKDKIYKYHIPEENRLKPPMIRLTVLSELPKSYGDDKLISWDCIIQVDVWDSAPPRKIALRVHELMHEIGLFQDTPTFEYDPETYLIRDCRRYRGILESNKNEVN